MEKKPHILNNTGNIEWFTPPHIVEAVREVFGGAIDLDPASNLEANKIIRAEKFFTIEDDALSHEWHGKIFLNPPYSRSLLPRFVQKLRTERIMQHVDEAIILTNAATETEWFEQLAAIATGFCFPRGRIKFIRPDGTASDQPTFGQVVTYVGCRNEKFFDVFKDFGSCMELRCTRSAMERKKI